MQVHTCPVCGYLGLDEPAYDPVFHSPSFSICPCCGCEFGYEDATAEAKEAYIRNWVKQGAPWFHPESKPINWNLKEQWQSIEINYDELIG